MGLLFGLFMAGIALWNEAEKEDIIRLKMAGDRNIAIYVSSSTQQTNKFGS